MWNLFEFRGEAPVEHEDVDYKVGKTLSRRHNSAIVVCYDHRAESSLLNLFSWRQGLRHFFCCMEMNFREPWGPKVACVLWLSCLVAQQNSLFQQKFTHMQFRPLLFLQTCLDAPLTVEELNRVENSTEDKAVPWVALVVTCECGAHLGTTTWLKKTKYVGLPLKAPNYSSLYHNAHDHSISV